MSDLIYAYSRPRREFGRHPDFQDYPPEIIVDIPPGVETKRQYIKADPYETEINCVPECSEKATNTERVTKQSNGMFHREGGWPKEVDVTEEEHKVRYRKKAEKDDSYVGVAKHLVSVSEEYIKQNSALDIYEEYFADEDYSGLEDYNSDPAWAKTVTVFNDPAKRKRTPVYLSWQPNDGRKLAIAFCNLSFPIINCASLLTSGESISSHLWDIGSPNIPELSFDPPNSPLTCLQYNPKEVYALAGGTQNGLLCHFDMRHKSKPVMVSRVENSHQHMVNDIKWLQNKPTEFFSVSSDGYILLWDTKKLTDPVDRIQLRPKASLDERDSNAQGGLCMDFNPMVGGPSKFMVGTEQGCALMCTRRGKSTSDRVTGVYHGHYGPVYAVERNPHNPKYFMTVGDWRVQLWMEEIRTPIISTHFHSSYLTDALWHSCRPAVLMVTRMDGVLDIWDFIYRTNQPLLSIQVADAGLHKLKVQPSGQHVAVGSAKGTTYLLELGAALYQPQREEKAQMSALLDRETVREKCLIQRQREMKQKMRRSSTDDDEIVQPAHNQSFFQQITYEYVKQLEQAGIETGHVLLDKIQLQASLGGIGDTNAATAGGTQLPSIGSTADIRQKPRTPSIQPGSPFASLIERQQATQSDTEASSPSTLPPPIQYDTTALPEGVQMRYGGHVSSQVTSIGLSSDGEYFVSGDQGSVHVVSLETGQRMAHFNCSSAVQHVALTPSMTQCVIFLTTKVEIIEVVTSKVLHSCTTNHPIHCAIVAESANHAVIGCDTGAVLIMDLHTGKISQQHTGHTARVNCLAVSPDSRYCISGGADGTINVIDIQENRKLYKYNLHTSSVSSLAITQDGSKFLSGSLDHTVHVVELITGKQLVRHHHSAEVLAVAVTPDGRLLISGAADNTVMVGSVEAANVPLRQYAQHQHCIKEVMTALDGSSIISTDESGVIHIISTTTGQPIQQWDNYMASDTSSTLQLTTDGTRMLLAGKDSKIYAVLIKSDDAKSPPAPPPIKRAPVPEVDEQSDTQAPPSQAPSEKTVSEIETPRDPPGDTPRSNQSLPSQASSTGRPASARSDFEKSKESENLPQVKSPKAGMSRQGSGNSNSNIVSASPSFPTSSGGSSAQLQANLPTIAQGSLTSPTGGQTTSQQATTQPEEQATTTSEQNVQDATRAATLTTDAVPAPKKKGRFSFSSR